MMTFATILIVIGAAALIGIVYILCSPHSCACCAPKKEVLLLEDQRGRCCKHGTPDKICEDCEAFSDALWRDAEHNIDALVEATLYEQQVRNRIAQFYSTLDPAVIISDPIPRCTGCGCDLRMMGCFCDEVGIPVTDWTRPLRKL